MSERRPGPFDDLFGGSGGGQQPPPQRPEPSQPDPAPPPRQEPPLRQEPPANPFSGAPRPIERDNAPAWGSEPAPRRDPRPLPPASDPFGTAPIPGAGRQAREETWAPPVSRPVGRSSARRGGRDPVPYVIGGVVFILALLVFALFLPPFELLGDSDESVQTIPDVCQGDDVEQQISEDIPPTPPNLLAVSPLRNLETTSGEPCGPLDITLNLTAVTDDGAGLGFYTFNDGSYRKISDATLTPDGTAVQGRLDLLPENILVIRSTGDNAQVEGFLAAGTVLDPAGQGILDVANPVTYAPAPDGTLTGGPPTAVADVTTIPVVRADTPEETLAVDTVLQNQATIDVHVESLAAQVIDNGLSGIELDYGCVSPGLRDAFTNMVTALKARVGDARVSVVVPSPEGGDNCANFGAYDLQSLADSVEFIKITPIRDQTIYRRAMTELLTAALATGVPRQKLLLIISPSSTFVGPDGIRQLISQRGALEQAAIPSLAEGEEPLPPSTAATFIGRRVDAGSGATGIGWSEEDLSVRFSYQDAEATFTYWIENRYSLAFKLDLVSRFQLGGVAIEDASDDPALADVWVPVSEYVDAGAPTLVQPSPEAFALEWRVDGTVAEGEAGATFIWQAVPTAGGQCSFGPSSASDHCVTLVVSDADIRVGGELPVTVDAGDGDGGDDGAAGDGDGGDGDDAGDGADDQGDGDGEPSPTATETQ